MLLIFIKKCAKLGLKIRENDQLEGTFYILVKKMASVRIDRSNSPFTEEEKIWIILGHKKLWNELQVCQAFRLQLVLNQQPATVEELKMILEKFAASRNQKVCQSQERWRFCIKSNWPNLVKLIIYLLQDYQVVLLKKKSFYVQFFKRFQYPSLNKPSPPSPQLMQKFVN